GAMTSPTEWPEWIWFQIHIWADCGYDQTFPIGIQGRRSNRSPQRPLAPSTCCADVTLTGGAQETDGQGGYSSSFTLTNACTLPQDYSVSIALEGSNDQTLWTTIQRTVTGTLTLQPGDNVVGSSVGPRLLPYQYYRFRLNGTALDGCSTQYAEMGPLPVYNPDPPPPRP